MPRLTTVAPERIASFTSSSEKPPPFVKSSIINYKKFRDFYCINLIANKKNNDICFFKFKPTILYKKALGIFTNELSSLISHIAIFHKASHSSFCMLDTENTIMKISKKINFYFNNKVKKELKIHGRLKTYQSLIDKLPYPNSLKFNIPLSYGFIHGDCSPDNLIITPYKVSFLDFDSIKIGFQLFDLTDLLLKYSNNPNKDEELKIIQEYFKITRFYKNSELIYLYNLINIISCYRGLLMALSTEYYCFEKQKFSSEIMDNLFLNKVLLLINNVKCRFEELKICQE